MPFYSTSIRFDSTPKRELVDSFAKRYFAKQSKKDSFVTAGFIETPDHFDIVCVFDKFAGCNDLQIRDEVIEFGKPIANLIDYCIANDIDIVYKLYAKHDSIPEMQQWNG